MSFLSSFINNVMGQAVSESKEVHNTGGTANGSQSISMNNESQDNCDPNVGFCKEPLEYNFIDFTKAKRSPIFDVDPMLLKKFIGHNVTVHSISRQEFNGCCLAIDPVSLSVILAKRASGGKIRVTTVPGYYLSKIKVDSNSVPAENSVSVNDLDVAELYHAPSLYTENKNTCMSSDTNLREGGESSVTDESRLAPKPISQKSDDINKLTEREEIMKRKQNLIDLLKNHRMPVTVREDILEIPGVKIMPPYTVECCETNNQMIKKKLGELMKSL